MKKTFADQVFFNGEIYTVNDNQPWAQAVAIKGDTKFLFDGDTHFITNGELGFITKDNDIHMDSINANIHLNSRLSKPIKDLPESIKERQKFEDNTFPMLNDMPENETGNLEKRIAFLEEMLGV